MRDPKARNISLGVDDRLKGAAGDAHTQAALVRLIARFRGQARQLVDDLCPDYAAKLRAAPTSFRPMQVETRAQS